VDFLFGLAQNQRLVVMIAGDWRDQSTAPPRSSSVIFGCMFELRGDARNFTGVESPRSNSLGVSPRGQVLAIRGNCRRCDRLRASVEIGMRDVPTCQSWAIIVPPMRCRALVIALQPATPSGE
jgi:hypothetical protein